MRCFVSAGHGPKAGGQYDPGADPPGPGEEHAIAEEIAREMAHAMVLVEPHVVPRGNLKTRIAYVNRWSRPGDVAVEVHLNSGTPDVAGCEVYFFSLEARRFAAEMHASLVKIGRAPRGVKVDASSQHPAGLAWCRQTKPWAALVEVAFLTNAEELKWLLGGGASLAGKALAKGVDSWP